METKVEMNVTANYDAACAQAMQLMKDGKNCCQAVLIAAGNAWKIELPAAFVDAAYYMGGGMQSGCACGALSGMVMAAGLREQTNPAPKGHKPGQELHDLFTKEFGASCCRVIRKKMGLAEKMGDKKCRELTGRTVVLLLKHLDDIDKNLSTPQ